jgi:hypothetical protein
MCYIRKRGGGLGLQLTQAPHIVLSPGWGSYVTFSDVDFLIPPRVMGIAGPKEDANILRALSLYLNSSLVSYYLFFHVPEWGVFRHARYVTLSELRKVPVPDFAPEQVEELVALHQRLIDAEEQSISEAFSKVQSLQRELLNSNSTTVLMTYPYRICSRGYHQNREIKSRARLSPFMRQRRKRLMRKSLICLTFLKTFACS